MSSPLRKPPPPQSPSDADADFARKAKKIAQAIRQEAGGRTCGGCAHAILNESGTGSCTVQANIHGVAITIVRKDAVACRKEYQPIDS